MTTNEQTPHEQFDELLEALWAGQLDRNGEAMLEALAAGDPELADRLRRERSLTQMLAAKGPNRAPEGLAAAVFARLDEQPEAQVVQVKPRKTRRPWFFSPQLRWGLAAAALVVVGIQGMWVIYREHPASPAEQIERYSMLGAAPDQAELTKSVSAAPASDEPAQQVKQRRERVKPEERRIAAVKPQPTSTPKAAEQQEKVVAMGNMEEGAPAIEGEAVKPSPAPTPEPPKPQAVTTPEPQPEKAVAAAEPKSASPEIAPGTGAWRAKPSRFEARQEERAVAAAPAAAREAAQPGLVMRIEMAAAQPAAEPAQPAQPAQGFSRTNMVRALAPAEPQRGVPMSSFAPQRVGSSVKPAEADRVLPMASSAPAASELRHAAAPAVVTHEQVVQAITAAGGAVKAVSQTRINPPAYKIDGSIPHANLPGFIERLNQMGIKASSGEAAGYSVLEGEELLARTDATTPTRQRAAGQIPLTILFDERR
ncbi:MAG: hypothetical protein ABFD69_00345 [Candidatus Sumerlaeia bacterium]